MAKYQASDIQILEGLDAVRMRPGMYIGSTGPRGLHHLIWEIVDNAIDEAMNGYASEISVTLKKDDSCEVSDNGRGIPVDIHPQLGVSAVEVVYTQLHAGGKFDNKSYAYSGGLHGVGASVVNALSEWLVVDVFQDFSHYQQRFESVEDKKAGKIISGRPAAPLSKIGNTRKRGTTVCFKPDPRVFEETSFNGDQVRRRIRELAYLNQGVTFRFTDERVKDAEKRTIEYRYEGGLADFVKYLNADKNEIGEPILLEGKKEGTMLRVAIQYTDSYTENLFSYVNNIPTGEGGTHETGFKAAITKVFNDYARRLGALKEKDNNLSGEDFREGMTSVIAASVQKPQFEGQTKGRLGNTEVRPIVEAIVTEQLALYLEDLKHQDLGQRIIEKAVQAARVREAARKARDVARQKNQLEAAPLVGKLSSCTGRDASKNELFIVEGDSAGGSAKQGRDRRFQAILPLRGKPLNAEKKRIDQVLANEEFRSIITALGTGIGEDFDAFLAEIQPRDHPVGRRPGRRAHPGDPAHLLLPLHARAGGGGARLHRDAAPVQVPEGVEPPLLLRRQGAGGRDQKNRPRLSAAALQRPWRNEPGAALGNHHEPRKPQAHSGDAGGRARGRAPRDGPDGRQGRPAPRVHQPARQLQP